VIPSVARKPMTCSIGSTLRFAGSLRSAQLTIKFVPFVGYAQNSVRPMRLVGGRIGAFLPAQCTAAPSSNPGANFGEILALSWNQRLLNERFPIESGRSISCRRSPGVRQY
jgi:hypothetical protein